MAIKYEKKKVKYSSLAYTLIAVILLVTIFLGMIGYLYQKRQAEAYESLHVQTKQVKDDLVLQLISDRENLATMASFAAKLYRDGENYSLLFESFKPIGMIENIGILNADNTFSTKAGTSVLDEKLSFEEEMEKGVYISGRIGDVTNEGYELIRSAVPIKVNDSVVGILYGAIKPESLGEKYASIVKELDAQLFVYEKSTGDIIIDTVHDELGNISFLKNREYNKGYSYEEFRKTDKGTVAFKSAYKDENLHMHYSTIEEFDWMIAMGRYDSQVFAETHKVSKIWLLSFILMILVIALYVLILMINERKSNAIVECASSVRKKLLETTDGQNNIQEALVEMCRFAKARAALFFDTDGEDYRYVSPERQQAALTDAEKKHFRAELFRYASELHTINGKIVNVMNVKPDKHMQKRDAEFFNFLNEHKIKEVSCVATINKANYITILAVVNPINGKSARTLGERVAACFSMALYNKNNLNKTILAATTDPLTGVLNRVAYKNDLSGYDNDKPTNFSCVFVDVNELHLWNNKYGHASGDAMLIYVANTLKDVFYGHKVYRMGGDEFLVFCRDVEQEKINRSVEDLQKEVETKNYHVAVGTSYRSQNNNTEEMVREAEIRMYEAKAAYYQNKKNKQESTAADDYIQLKTGISEIDTLISVLKENYNGIYRVSMANDKAKRILMPAYLNYNEDEEQFSKLFSRYVAETVEADYRRGLMNFLNYDALKRVLMEGKIPQISYRKNNGEDVMLSVYKLDESDEMVNGTLWVFGKK